MGFKRCAPTRKEKLEWKTEPYQQHDTTRAGVALLHLLLGDPETSSTARGLGSEADFCSVRRYLGIYDSFKTADRGGVISKYKTVARP